MSDRKSVIPTKIWYEQIPCQGGAFIGLYSLNPLILKLHTPRVQNAKKIWEAIKGNPGARADFRFDGEADIYFPVGAVHQVAKVAGARRKRRLAESLRGKFAGGRLKGMEALKIGKFSPATASEITSI